jgi:hypothetical protein
MLKLWLTVGVLHSLQGISKGWSDKTQQLFEEIQAANDEEHNDTQSINFEACFTICSAFHYMDNYARNNAQCSHMSQSHVNSVLLWPTLNVNR